MEQKSNLKYIVIPCSEEAHNELKARAAQKGMTLKYYAGLALDAFLAKERARENQKG